LALLGSQLVLFAILSNRVAKIFFLVYFAFWRTAYDLGLGWILTKQSKRRWMVREVQRRGWMNESKRPVMRNWIKNQLVGKMGKDYSFNVRFSKTAARCPYLTDFSQELPVEYNTWLLFRQLVDVILLK
jgi:phosphatidylethanolamine N-methyltransferase